MSEKVSLEELIYRVRDCYLLLANKFNEKQAVIQELERENKELKKKLNEFELPMTLEGKLAVPRRAEEIERRGRIAELKLTLAEMEEKGLENMVICKAWVKERLAELEGLK